MSFQRGNIQRQVIWLAALDALCLLIGMLAAIIVRLGTESLQEYVFAYLSGWLYLVIAILASNFVTGSYGLELKVSRFNMVVNWAFSVIVAILVVSITSYAWLNAVLGRGVLALTVLIYSGLWLTMRLLIYYYFFRKDSFAYRVAILGTGSKAKADFALIQNVHLRPKHKVVALIQLEHESQKREFEQTEFSHKGVVHCFPGRLAETVRELGCDFLFIAVEREEELAGVYPQLRRLKFEAHNREWLLVIQSEQGADQQGLPPDGGAEGSSRPCGPYNLTTSAPVGAGAHGDDGPGFHGQYSQQGRIAAFWGPVSTGGAPPAATLAPQAVSAL